MKLALEKHSYNQVLTIADKVSGVKQYSKGEFEVISGLVHYENQPLPEALSKRLFQFMEKNLPSAPLRNFWKNLKENPSEDARKDLYLFLENRGIPITEDGCFTAYKYVDADFKDQRTHTFDNSVGSIVKMPREQVNADRNQTCSSGLHVGAWEYVRNSISNDENVVEVKVNPKNVVAVPVDYHAQKMRVCEYEVVSVVSNAKELPADANVHPEPLNSLRTYYYRGTKNQKFNAKLVSSKKPSRVTKHIRAHTKAEAVKKIQDLLDI